MFGKKKFFWGFDQRSTVYNSITCICKLGKLNEVERIFEIMNKKTCMSSNVTYTALVHAYGIPMDRESVYGLLMQMRGLAWCPHFHTHCLVNKI